MSYVPDVHECCGISVLSRGTAVTALVKNYAVLLTFSRANAGHATALAANERLRKEEVALEIRANESRHQAE